MWGGRTKVITTVVGALHCRNNTAKIKRKSEDHDVHTSTELIQRSALLRTAAMHIRSTARKELAIGVARKGGWDPPPRSIFANSSSSTLKPLLRLAPALFQFLQHVQDGAMEYNKG